MILMFKTFKLRVSLKEDHSVSLKENHGEKIVVRTNSRQHHTAFGSSLQPKQSREHECSEVPERYAGEHSATGHC